LTILSLCKTQVSAGAIGYHRVTSVLWENLHCLSLPHYPCTIPQRIALRLCVTVCKELHRLHGNLVIPRSKIYDLGNDLFTYLVTISWNTVRLLKKKSYDVSRRQLKRHLFRQRYDQLRRYIFSPNHLVYVIDLDNRILAAVHCVYCFNLYMYFTWGLFLWMITTMPLSVLQLSFCCRQDCSLQEPLKKPQFTPKSLLLTAHTTSDGVLLRLMLTSPAGLCWWLDRSARTTSCYVAWQLQYWPLHIAEPYKHQVYL